MNPEMRDALEFVFSSECRLEPPPSKAIISATTGPRDFAIKPGEGEYVPLSATPGGRALAQVLAQRNLTRLEEEKIWRAAETKYLMLATGDLRVIAEPSERPAPGFFASAVPALLANKKLISVNGDSIESLRRLSLENPALGRMEAGETLFSNARGVTESTALRESRRKLDCQAQAIDRAVKELVEQPLRESVGRIQELESKRFSQVVAMHSHDATYNARLVTKKWLPVLVAYHWKRWSLRSALQRTETEYSAAVAELAGTSKRLLTDSMLTQINERANRHLEILGAPELRQYLSPPRKETLVAQIAQVQKELAASQNIPGPAAVHGKVRGPGRNL